MYKLVIEDDEGKTTVVPIIRDEITIGRKEGNTIRLTERNVSRRHAKLMKKNGQIEIEDVASRHGIRRNGQKIDGRVPFREGDVIIIGDYRLRLQVEKPKAEAEPEPKAEVAAPVEPEELPDHQAARIVVISSNFAGREFYLTRKEMVIGRTEGDIRIDHRSISRHHAKLVRDGQRYKVLDLNSANGVKVNGEEYRAVQLKRGDLIELGHVRLRFVEPGEDFVFLPQAEDAEDEPAPSGGMGRVALFGGVVAVLVIIVAVLAVVLLGDDKAPEETPGVATNNAPEDSPDPAGSDMLARGNEFMEKEEWDRAMFAFDEVLRVDPNDKVAQEKKSIAAREKPFKDSFERGKRALDSRDYEGARKAFGEIPEVSLYYSRLRDEGLLDAATQGLVSKHLEDARASLNRKDYSGARAAVSKALDLDPESSDAKGLRAEVSRREGREEPGTAPPRDKMDKVEQAPPPDKGGDKGGNPDERRAKLQELLNSARQKSLQGDQGGAIADATEALKYGGGIQAHYQLGIAYEKQGNNGKAVEHYNVWLKANCGNKLGDVVRQKILKFGGTPSC